jgi:hypothetical protein
MATIAEQVGAAAEAFADYEEAIQAFKKTGVRALCAELFKTGQIGFLEYQRTAAAFEAMVSEHEAQTYAMHAELTKRAQELGIDLPQTRGGGDR